MSKIQNEGVKSEAELLAAGGAKSQLINDTKIYVTADGLNKRLDEAIIDGDIGGGGSGGINHLLDQSEDAALWTNDVNFTITDNITNPLRGDQDLLIEKAGVDASGEVVSVPFTIDDADKGKKLPLSFDYKNSGTYQDGDYEIEIYDVSSAIVVSNTNPSIISQDNFTASHLTYWDANFASTSYELRVKCITADTNTSSMQVDNLQTGPVNCKAGGSYISDFTEPEIVSTSWGASITANCFYRREGSMAKISYILDNLVGAMPASVLTVDMPSGLVIDHVNVPAGYTYEVGSGVIQETGVNWYPVNIITSETSNALTVLGEKDNVSGVGSTFLFSNNPVAMDSTDKITFTIDVPIVGWGTGIKPAEVISGRTFVAEGVGNAETVITAAVTNIDFTVTRDEGGAFSGTEYTAQETGDYNVDGMVFFQGAPQFRAVDTYRDTGSGYAEYKRVGSTLTDGAFHFSGNVFLNKGDKLAFRMAGVGGTLSNSIPSVHWVKISKENSLNAQLLPDDTASNINAAIISDWESFTPTGSWTTNTTYTGQYRRVGSQLEVTGNITLSGAPNAASLSVNLPSGLAIDLNKVEGTLSRVNFGEGHILDSGTQEYVMHVAGNGETSVRMMFEETITGTELGGVFQNGPITFAAGDELNYRYYVPIQGWETGIKPTEVVSGRLHTFHTVGQGTTSLPDATITKLTNWATPTKDESGAWDAVNSRYLVQESGTYEVKGAFRATDPADSDMFRVFASIGINGSWLYSSPTSSIILAGTNTCGTEISRLVEAQAGDYIELGGYQDNADNDTNATTAGSVELFQYFSVIKQNNLSAQIQPTETVAAKYKDTSGQSLTGTGSAISYPTKVHDTHNMMNGSFDTFVIPVSGLYLVSGSIGTAGGTPFAADANIQLRAVKNGIDITRSFTRTRASSTSYMVETLAQEYFTAGDTLQLHYYGSVNTNADTTDFRNYTAITKIGN